jgi:hypothetical protein
VVSTTLGVAERILSAPFAKSLYAIDTALAADSSSTFAAASSRLMPDTRSVLEFMGLISELSAMPR